MSVDPDDLQRAGRVRGVFLKKIKETKPRRPAKEYPHKLTIHEWRAKRGGQAEDELLNDKNIEGEESDPVENYE